MLRYSHVESTKFLVGGNSMSTKANLIAFQPGEIVLCATGNEWGVFKPLFKYLVGKWGHAMIYTFDMKNFMNQDIPWFVEARPKKGVSIVSGRNYQGYHIAVFRVKGYPELGILAADEAEKRASDPETLYDFHGILLCILKLFDKKLGRKIQAWKPNKWVICSELVAECYSTIGLNLELGSGIPLPGDFYTCPQLEKVFEGELII